MVNATHQLVGAITNDYSDPRRGAKDDFESHLVHGRTAFTANGAGTTTTIVGANAAPGTNDNNVVRRGEKFKLFTSAGALKEEKVFEITTIAVGASTTVTFAPAAAVATASGDFLKLVATDHLKSMDDLDTRLLALGFTQAYIDKLNLNDKLFQIRIKDEPHSINPTKPPVG